MKNPGQLIDAILRNPSICDSGVISNELLGRFFRGYPIENLRRLISSDNERVQGIGVFIASELGNRAAPLLKDVAKLLSHPVPILRYNAIDSMLTCTADCDENEIATVVLLLNDPEGPVRRKAMDFLSRASENQLRAALKHFENLEPNSPHVLGIGGLIGDRKWNSAETRRFMQHKDPILRKYGVVAASRMVTHDCEPLIFGSGADDEDIKRFANDVIELRNVQSG